MARHGAVGPGLPPEVVGVLEDHGPQPGRLRHLEQLVAALAALQPVEGLGELGLGRQPLLLDDDGQAEVDRETSLRSGRACSAMKSSSAVITPLRGRPPPRRCTSSG